MKDRTYRKEEPSELDIAIFVATKVNNMTAEEAATMFEMSIHTVNYHLKEYKRLSNVDGAILNKYLRQAIIPAKIEAVKLLTEALGSRERMPSGALAHVDTALKLLKGDVLVDVQEVTHTLKDSTPADQAFAEVMARYKAAATDAQVVTNDALLQPSLGAVTQVDSSVSPTDQSVSESTPTSPESSEMLILPLDKSHVENPKLPESPLDDSLTDLLVESESLDRLRRDEDY